MGLAGSLFGFVLASYWSVRAWRSSPDAWRALIRQRRPASWEHWPISSRCFAFSSRNSKEFFREFVKGRFGVLTIAGNRESVQPGIQQAVKSFLIEAIAAGEQMTMAES